MRVALAAFRSKPFRLLFAGELVSLLGTALAPVALAFAVLDLTGSATDLGYVLAAGWLPQIVFILIGGVLGDRLPRNLVMVGANLLSAAAPGWAIAFDAATYLASALILVQIRIPRVVVERGETIIRLLVEGWNEFRSREWLWVIVVSASVGNLVATASFAVLGPLIAK